MSIFASFAIFDDDWPESYPAPIAYRGSHIMPTLGDDRTGSLDLGFIPGFVTDDGWCVLGVDHRLQADHEDCRCEPLKELPPVWPFLRVSMEPDTVILDRSQVEKLRDHLTDWLGRTS